MTATSPQEGARRGAKCNHASGCRQEPVGFALAERGEVNRDGLPVGWEPRCLTHALERATERVTAATYYQGQLYRLADVLPPDPRWDVWSRCEDLAEAIETRRRRAMARAAS